MRVGVGSGIGKMPVSGALTPDVRIRSREGRGSRALAGELSGLSRGLPGGIPRAYPNPDPARAFGEVSGPVRDRVLAGVLGPVLSRSLAGLRAGCPRPGFTGRLSQAPADTLGERPRVSGVLSGRPGD